MKTNWNELIPNLNWIEGIGFCKQADINSLQYIDEEGNLKNVEILREWDYIKDGKYYVGSGQITLDGSENISLDGNRIIIKLSGNFENEQLISDKLKVIPLSDLLAGEKGVAIQKRSDSMSYIWCNIGEIDTPEKMIIYLQDNPTTVVYQLAEPKVYDLVSPINLSSYEDETIVECNSGTISPTMRFEMTSYITELIKSNRDRIDELEDLHLSYLATLLENETRITLLELGLPQGDDVVDDGGMDIIE